MKDTLPPVNEAPNGYYEMSLEEARLLLEPRMGELVSFKLRPIAEWSPESGVGFENRYVYPEEYARIYQFLAAYNVNGSGQVSRGQATAYEKDGGDFLFVEHHTGPEIVLYTGDAMGMSLAKSVVDLIIKVIKTISKSSEEKKAGKKSGRLFEVHSMVIEKRTRNGARILSLVRLPVKKTDLDQGMLLHQVVNG